jgi:hypothetical protein
MNESDISPFFWHKFAHNKKAEIQLLVNQLFSNKHVPEAGIEPARPQWPKDFKSFVSTYFTIRAPEKKPPCQ